MREFSAEESTKEPYTWLITGKVTGITIAVYIGSENFRTLDNELQFYVTTERDTVYFQTIHYRHQKVSYIIAGIEWFIAGHLIAISPLQSY
jgi:hypothetical protein